MPLSVPLSDTSLLSPGIVLLSEPFIPLSESVMEGVAGALTHEERSMVETTMSAIAKLIDFFIFELLS